MSDKEQWDEEVVVPQPGRDADTTRRRFTRLGVGAPVLMTLASQPVFGVNCLSNGMSGNMSDPDRMRGNCQFGMSIDYLLSDAGMNWGMPYGPETRLGDTPLAGAAHIFGQDTQNKKLMHILEKGDNKQKYVVAALVNTNPDMGMGNFILSEAQLMQLVYREIQPPYGLSLTNYLRWALGEG